MSNLISIIIPIYKVEKYLHKCIDSIINQTYTNLEIILVNDGSPDNCGIICDEYAKIDNRIKVIHKSNGGLSSARNAGLDIATGEYIGFVDSDDYTLPDMYEKLYNSLTSNDADLVICGYTWVDEDGNKHSKHNYPLKSEVLTKSVALQRLTDRSNVVYITAVNKLYKYSLLTAVRFPEGRLHEDEFTIHHIMDKCEKIVTISDELYMYVQRSTSIMNSTFSLKRLDAWYAAYDRYLFFKQKDNKRLANIAFRGCYGTLISALQKLDMSVLANRKALRPLYWRTLFRLILNLDLRFGKLILASNRHLWNFAKKTRDFLQFLRFISYFPLELFKSRSPRIFLMATPVHGNLGDQAIVYAERALLSNLCRGKDIVEVRNPDYLLFSHHIEKFVRPNDIIVIDGGGNLGTLWENEDDKISDIISRFHGNKIMIFPQTCYYSNDKAGEERLKRNMKTYSLAKDLTIMFRDKASYDFAKQNFGAINCLFVPDIVLSINTAVRSCERNGVLLCFRQDHERIISNLTEHKVKTYLRDKNIVFAETDTVIPEKVVPYTRISKLNAKWDEFGKSNLIITDRLHGLLFAAITGTPCIAVDNKSKKVSGSYEFIKELPHICCLEDENEIVTKIFEYYGKASDFTFSYPIESIKDVM